MSHSRLLVALLATAGIARAHTYYVDAGQGNDLNAGDTPESAWRSFMPVNTHTFVPGDELRLKAGDHWTGETLHPQGSGSDAHPIVVDRYGEGSDPSLVGEGKVPAVVTLHNQQYWEIRHLEISNKAAGESPLLRGVELSAADSGPIHHLVLSGLKVHDVTGPSTPYEDTDSQRKQYGGIAFLITGRTTRTYWQDLLIENCKVTDVNAIGIVFASSWTKGHRTEDPATWAPSHGVVIRGNTIERTARNGLIVRASAAPLIEHNLFRECAIAGSGNACFAFDCDDAVFQFNESCFTKYNPGDADAGGFDSDWNCRRTVIQDNYSHDNEYGFVLVCCMGGGFNEGTIVRRNVSKNDQGNLIRISGTTSHTLIEDNTLYVASDMKNPKDPAVGPRIVYFKSWKGWAKDTEFRDNDIINEAKDAHYDFGQATDVRFDGNRFDGRHPSSEPTQEPTSLKGPPTPASP